MDQEFRIQEHVQEQMQMISDKLASEQPTGFPDEERLAKLRYKNSTLIPPPPKIEQRKNRWFKDRIAQLKLRLRAIFKRIRFGNAEMISKYKINPIPANLMYLEQPECTQFLAEYENAANSKFNRINSNKRSLMREFQYKETEKQIEITENWMDKLENKMKKKYEARIKRRLQIMKLKEKYYEYQSVLYQGATNQEGYNIGEAINFSMSQIAAEVNQLMMQKEEQTATQQLDHIYQKVEKKFISQMPQMNSDRSSSSQRQ